MLDRDAQEKIIDQLISKINEFDYDLLVKLQDKIEYELEHNSPEDQFIKLYEIVESKLNYLEYHPNECPYDIYDYFWHKLFEGKNSIINRAYKLHPFDTDIVDSSYEDEVRWIMSNWKDSVEAIKDQKEKDKYWDNI